MKALVTGGGGFLGGAILDRLSDVAEERRSFSRGAYPDLAAKGITHYQASLTDLDALREASKGVDIIFHTAALPGAWGKYETYFDANVVGSRNVLQAAKDNGVRAIVHTSTPSVVHADEGIQGADESLPMATHFLAHYPKTKAIAEAEMLSASTPELKICALRPHLIWGPGDRHLIPRLAQRAQAGRLKMIGPPAPTVDSCYIDDAAEAHYLAALDLLGEGKSAGKAYFISQGEPWAIDELTQQILASVGVDWQKRYVSRSVAFTAGRLCELWFRTFGIQREPPMTRFIASQLSTDHWYCIDAAKADFGFVPSRTIGDALAALRASVDAGRYEVVAPPS